MNEPVTIVNQGQARTWYPRRMDLQLLDETSCNAGPSWVDPAPAQRSRKVPRGRPDLGALLTLACIGVTGLGVWWIGGAIKAALP